MRSVSPILRGLLRSTRSRFSTTKSALPSSSPPSSSTSLSPPASPTPPSPHQPLGPPTPTPSSDPNAQSQNGNGNPNPGNQNNDDTTQSSWLGHPLRIALTTLKFVACAHLLWEYGISMAPASGPSMLPTFEVVGEWLLVSKLHRFGRGVGVGDVVAYSIPVNEEVGVKRVLGMGGDYVLMDAPVGGEGVGVGGGMGGGTGGGGGGHMIQVPQGHCWIVGDNLAASRDSRYFGPVPLGLIRGKVIATMRPFSEFKWITNPLRKADSSVES